MRTLALSCGAGCAGVCATRCEGTRALDAFDACAHGSCVGRGSGTATVAEPPAAPVGPQQRARVDDESRPEMPQVM